MKQADFAAARTKIRPSALREVMVEVPATRWEDVGGMEDIKQSLKVCFVLEIQGLAPGFSPTFAFMSSIPISGGRMSLSMTLSKASRCAFVSNIEVSASG